MISLEQNILDIIYNQRFNMLYLIAYYYVLEITTQMIRYNFCRFGIKKNKTLNFCKFPIMLALELCNVQF